MMSVPVGNTQPPPSGFDVGEHLRQRYDAAIAEGRPESLKTAHIITRVIHRAYSPDPNLEGVENDPRYLGDVARFCLTNRWINDVELTAYDDMMAILVENGWYPHIIELPQAKFTKDIHAWCNDQFGPQWWHDPHVEVITDGHSIPVPRLTQQSLERAAWMVVNKDGKSLIPLFAFRKAEHAVAFKVRWV